MNKIKQKIKCFFGYHNLNDYQTKKTNNGNLVIFCEDCHKEWFQNYRRVNKIEWGIYFNRATKLCPNIGVEYGGMIPCVNSVACQECKHHKGVEGFHVLCDF